MSAVGPWMNDAARDNLYKYNGKELNEDCGFNWYDYGARWYDASIGRWGQVDPLAEKYFFLNTFNYTANNPINALDPDGEKIIFVNGYLGFGSPEGGEAYWNGRNSDFVEGAQRYLGDNDVYFTDVKYGNLSSARERMKAGEKWANENYEKITQGMDMKNDDFKFITHSMGAAFAEGALRYLKKEGWNVSQVVHFESFQADGFEAHTDPPFYGTIYNTTIGTFTVDYQLDNDWVINNIPLISNPGQIMGATVNISVKGKNDYDTRHREPIDRGDVWKVLSELISEALQRKENTHINIKNNENR